MKGTARTKRVNMKDNEAHLNLYLIGTFLIGSLIFILLLFSMLAPGRFFQSHPENSIGKSIQEEYHKQKKQGDPGGIITQAITSKNSSLCPMINDPLVRKECRAAVQAASQPAAIPSCQDLPNQEARLICADRKYLQQARETRDPAVCRKIIYSDYAKECEGIFQE